METTTLQAEVRDTRGKGPARRLRAQGKVPGVFYGPGLEPTPLTLSPKELEKALRGERGRNVVFKLSVGGKDELAMVKDLTKADVVMSLRNYYRKRPHRIEEAERRGIPIYVLRNNSAAQIESYLAEIFGIEAGENDFERAVRETRDAILRVQGGDHQVELSPQNAYVRRLQHRMAREAQLISHSKGKEPRRRVLLYENKRLPY